MRMPWVLIVLTTSTVACASTAAPQTAPPPIVAATTPTPAPGAPAKVEPPAAPVDNTPPRPDCTQFWPQTLAGVAPDTLRKDIEKVLGKPSKATCKKLSEADAEEGVRFTYCDLTWAKRGLSITFRDEEDGKTFYATTINLAAPSKDTTADGTGIGASMKSLRATYGACLDGDEGSYYLTQPPTPEDGPEFPSLMFTVSSDDEAGTVTGLQLDTPNHMP